MTRPACITALLLMLILLTAAAVSSVRATSMLPQNVVDLVSLSRHILVGEVVGLTDGIDVRNLPYTEVTLQVRDSILGSTGSTFTFRQFGLLAPRSMPDGLTNLQVSPAGWPRFERGEQVMVFVYRKAEITGLQTTVGLFQGKFTIVDDQIVNEIDNRNLFHRVEVDVAALTADERRLFDQRGGALPANEFIELVRKAVQEHWIEQGRLTHAQR